MAFEVVKIYKEHFPKLRFIGKRYTNDDRTDGGFGEKWGEWFGNGFFDILEKNEPHKPYDEAYIGLMLMKADNSDFAYWIGMFFPHDADVPTGFDFIDLPESDIGVGWVYGNEKNGEVYGVDPHAEVCKMLEAENMGNNRDDIMGKDSGTYCFFERYNCPRFTNPDEKGNIILDYGNYIL